MFTDTDYDRLSLSTALIKGDYLRAFQKVEENMKLLEEKQKELVDYAGKMGTEREAEKGGEGINEKIEETGKILVQTDQFIDDIKQFKYSNLKTKNENLYNLKRLEREYLNKREAFQRIMKKIKERGESMIESARNSIRKSSAFNGEFNNSQNYELQDINNINNTESQQIFSTSNLLKEIEDKEKQVNTILKITNQINDLSKKTAEIVAGTGEKLMNIEDNIGNMQANIENAVDHMKKAKEVNESNTGGYTNYCFYVVLGIVGFLLFLVLIMP